MALLEIDCNGPGIKRRRAGRGFVYLDEDGTRVADDEVIERIRSLAIPRVCGDTLIFDYDAKSGQHRLCEVVDPEVRRVVTTLRRRRAVSTVVKQVAEHLGNTPAVARSACIDPLVVESFQPDDTVVDVLVGLDEDDLSGGVPAELEQAVVELIGRS